jgi:hypothetical protein
MMQSRIRGLVAGGVLTAVAVTTMIQSGAVSAAATPVKKSQKNHTCIGAAVVKRENAVITALDTYHTELRAAFVARRDALETAWNKSNAKERRAAILKAWADFREARRKARAKLQSARKAAWLQFTTERRACGKAISPEDASGEKQDEQI